MKYLFSVLIIVSFVFSQTTTKIGDTYFNSNKNKTQSYILDNETNEQETDPWNK